MTGQTGWTATRAISRGWASSPTLRSASAARPARWPARNGIGVPEDGLALTGMSYDNSVGLGADTWRHVAFIEQERSVNVTGGGGADGGAAPARARRADRGMRWLMSSDVCKHCTHAACLDVCPTGALMRTEFGTVVVQEDVCNGCGYCIPACPYGVIDQRRRTAGPGSAPCATTGSGPGWSPPAPRPARPIPSSSGRSTSCANAAGRASGTAARGRARPSARLYGNEPGDGVGRGRSLLPAARRA